MSEGRAYLKTILSFRIKPENKRQRIKPEKASVASPSIRAAKRGGALTSLQLVKLAEVPNSSYYPSLWVSSRTPHGTDRGPKKQILCYPCHGTNKVLGKGILRPPPDSCENRVLSDKERQEQENWTNQRHSKNTDGYDDPRPHACESTMSRSISQCPTKENEPNSVSDKPDSLRKAYSPPGARQPDLRLRSHMTK